MSKLPQFISEKGHCYFIAEIGCNHNGSLQIAKDMVAAAKDAGADAVKFQIFSADELYERGTVEYRKLKSEELHFEEFMDLNDYCQQQQIDFIATPFDFKSIDFLDSINVRAIKIGSGELDYYYFLKYAAEKNISILLSTGMGNNKLIEHAVNIIRQFSDAEIVLLHCISSYPADLIDSNISVLPVLEEKFNCPAGLSDHCLEPYAAYAAVSLGACVIEKHFTLDRNMPGDDHSMSLEPYELKKTIKGVHQIELALGFPEKEIKPCEEFCMENSRRALYARTAIRKGDIFSMDNIIVRRPAHKIFASFLERFLGEKAGVNISESEKIKLEFIEKKSC